MLQGWVLHGSGWAWRTGPLGFQPHCSDLAVVDSMSKHVDVLWRVLRKNSRFISSFESMPRLRYSLAHRLQSCEVWFPRRRSSPRPLEKQILPGNRISHLHCLRLSVKKTPLRFSEKIHSCLRKRPLILLRRHQLRNWTWYKMVN